MLEEIKMNKAKIFISEDETIIAKDLEERLKRLGYTVSGMAATGEKTLKGIEETKPDIILLDIVLKGPMDGIEIADYVRRNYDIPIIFLTAYADAETLQRAKLTEPFGYILKPFEQRELYVTIEVALYKHKLESKLKQNEQWLQTILESISDGIIAIDTQQTVKFLNSSAELITGWSRGDLIGKPIMELFQTEVSPNQGTTHESWLISRAGRTKLHKRDGNPISLDYKTSPIRDSNGNVLGVVFVLEERKVAVS